MSGQPFDATQRAPGISRRGSLRNAGSASLGALVTSRVAAAGKSSKKANKRARKKGKKKCRKQDGQCAAAFADLCAGQEGAEECEAIFSPCCAFLAQCQATAFFDCVFSQGS
jgi:hypothetical protein